MKSIPFYFSSLALLTLMTACMEVETPSEMKVNEETKVTFNIEAEGSVYNREATDYVWSYPLFCIGIKKDDIGKIDFSKFDITLTYGSQTSNELEFKNSDEVVSAAALKKHASSSYDPSERTFKCIESLERLPFARGLEAKIDVTFAAKEAGNYGLTAVFIMDPNSEREPHTSSKFFEISVVE